MLWFIEGFRAFDRVSAILYSELVYQKSVNFLTA